MPTLLADKGLRPQWLTHTANSFTFSKSDPQLAQHALSACRKFGFQLVTVATVQNASTIQPYIDSV